MLEKEGRPTTNIEAADKIDKTQLAWRQSPQGKISKKKRMQKYLTSEKGKETLARYSESEKGRLAFRKWYHSGKGQENREISRDTRTLMKRASDWLKDHPGSTPEEALKEVQK